MKRRTYVLILMIEAVFCMAAVFLRIRPGTVWWEAVSFPFAQTGEILRRLSLSGAAGNMAAVAAYLIIGLLPFGCLLYRFLKRRVHWEDSLLGILSVLLFWGIYLYINPALFGAFVPMSELAEGGKLMFSSCIWAVLVGYVILRMLRSFGKTERSGTEISCLPFLLRCMSAMLVFTLCFSDFGNSLEALAAVEGSNNGALKSRIFMTALVIGLHFLENAMATALEVWLLFRAERLLEALAEDRYSEESQKRAYDLYGVCRITVYANVISGVSLNLFQLLLGKYLLDADYLIRIPVDRIALTLAVMVAAKYLAEGRKIKQENDLFI